MSLVLQGHAEIVLHHLGNVLVMDLLPLPYQQTDYDDDQLNIIQYIAIFITMICDILINNNNNGYF